MKLSMSDSMGGSKFLDRACYKPIRKAFNATDRAILLYGPTGSGKTAFWHQVAKENNMTVTRVCVDDTVSLRELQGGVSLAAQEGCTVSKWDDGIMVEAITKPNNILLLDELSRISATKVSPANSLIDSGKMYVRGAGWYEKHPTVRIVGTMNPHDGRYAGTCRVDLSLINRFLGFYLGHLTVEELGKLVGIDGEIRKRLLSFYEKAQEAIKINQLDVELSLRNIEGIVALYKGGLSLSESIDAGFLSSVKMTDPEQAEVLDGVVSSTFGTMVVTPTYYDGVAKEERVEEIPVQGNPEEDPNSLEAINAALGL